LLVGLTFAKGLALSLNKNFIAVNHIEGHIYSGFLMPEKPEFPFLCLVVSGGHTLLLLVKSFDHIYKLGSTIDDAAGEAFDKVSKLLGLGYPGGPKIQISAINGDENRIKFPVSDLKNSYDFSFSGLKTSVLRYVQSQGGLDKLDDQHIADISASFQKAVIRALLNKLESALKQFEVNSISIVGGVAANNFLKKEANILAVNYGKKIVIPSLEFCGDNAAMIAFRAETLFKLGRRDSLNFKPFPSLDDNSFLNLKLLTEDKDKKKLQKELEIIRNKIDSIDDKLKSLLIQRFDLIEKVVEIKNNLDADYFDSKRESIIYEMLLKELPSDKINTVQNIFERILDESRIYQKEIINKKDFNAR
jgi:N6-L-threonylcarbamoyladenine synthase